MGTSSSEPPAAEVADAAVPPEEEPDKSADSPPCFCVDEDGDTEAVTWDHHPAAENRAIGPAAASHSISPAALAAAENTEAPLFAEVHQAGSASEGAIAYNAVWKGSKKCLFSPAGIDQFGKPVPYLRVFDLESDPEEMQPVIPEDGSDLACWKDLRSWVETWVQQRDRLNGAAEVTIDEEIRDQMKALGYLQ